MSTFSAKLFYQYHICPHWIWHDVHTDANRKGDLPELMATLLEQGVSHTADILADLDNVVTIPQHSREQKITDTLLAMRQGATYIYKGLLQASIENVDYLGAPDLLEKRTGPSELGNYYYVPVDIKSSNDIKREQRLALGYYAMLLEQIQGTRPQELTIINRDKERIIASNSPAFRQRLVRTITRILSIRSGQKPPLHLASRCKNSPWYAYCIEEAREAHDIALLYKLNPSSAIALREVGINTIEELAARPSESIPHLPYLTDSAIKRLQLQANALIHNQIYWLRKPNLPQASIEIFFDIEGDPLTQVEYLFGFVVRGDVKKVLATGDAVRVGKNENEYYVYFLAKDPSDESAMWERLAKWLQRAVELRSPIFHYADYEKNKLKSLAKKYGHENTVNAMLHQMVDVQKAVQHSVVLPLYFYSLKDIAAADFIGYEWRSEKAGGAQSIFWYEDWLQSGEQSTLETILDYNEDDARACMALTDWLRTAYTSDESVL